MSKVLRLMPRSPDGRGNPTWHDYAALSFAIAAIIKGKPIMKAAMWLAIAGRMQAVAEGAEYGRLVPLEFDGQRVMSADGRPAYKQQLPPLEVELSNTEARVLWRELKKLKPEQFGPDGQTPPMPGPHYAMICSIAVDLGCAFEPEEDGLEDDEPETPGMEG